MHLAIWHVMVISTVTVITNSCYTRSGQFRAPEGTQKIRPSLQDLPKVHLTFSQERIRTFGASINKSTEDGLQVLKRAKLDKNPQENLGNSPSPAKLMKKLIGHLFPNETIAHGPFKQGLNLSLDYSGIAKLGTNTSFNLQEDQGLLPTDFSRGMDVFHQQPLHLPAGRLEPNLSFHWPVINKQNLPKQIKSRSIGLKLNQTGRHSPDLLQEKIGVTSPERSMSDQ